MSAQLAAALELLPRYLSAHVLLSALALLIGVGVSLPLAAFAYRRPRWRWPLLAAAGLIQTVPSLALLALFYPLLLALSGAAESLIGARFSALGFLPALLALTLYSVLPILRGAVTGLLGVDPDVIEAARGVGMTQRQRLLRVEAPLALPSLMAGVRTAAVWVIGTATLATAVGQTSLGNFIFSGLQTENWVFVLMGCAGACGLALVADQLLQLIEAGLRARDRKRLALGGAGFALGLLAALAPAFGGGGPDYRIGAKNFSEQFILAQLVQQRLEAGGAAARITSGLGSAVIFRALASGDLDVYVDYSGTLWTNVLLRTDIPPREQLLRELGLELERRHGVTLLGPLGFENAYALAMRRERAEALGIASIADLAARAGGLAIGADVEFFARPEWEALRQAYGLSFKSRRSLQPTLMHPALAAGEVDVISAFSSDGRIARDDLLVLADPKGAIPPYDAVLLLAPGRGKDARLRAALRPLIGAIPVEAMRQANLRVDREEEKQSPGESARALAAELALDPGA